MDLNPAFQNHIRGNFWDGADISYEIETDDGLLGIDLTGCIITADFKATRNGDTDFTYTTEDSSIIIDSASPWKFSFAKGIINHTPNTYYFDIEIIYPNAEVETILTSSWTILSDITNV